jgi:hypothetical protein
MNPRICLKSTNGRHNFPIPGGDCANGCGTNQAELSGGSKPIQKTLTFDLSRYLPNKNAKPERYIHSELHEFVKKARETFGETADKGVGSFAFYLGLLKKVPVHTLYMWLGDAKECSTREIMRKRFWKRYKEWKKPKPPG